MATKEEPDRAQEIYETVAEYSSNDNFIDLLKILKTLVFTQDWIYQPI